MVDPNETAEQRDRRYKRIRAQRKRDQEKSANKSGGIGCLVLVAVVSVYVIFVNNSDNSVTYSSNSNKPSQRISISEADTGKPWSGDNWPFTVSSGELKCDRNAVVFIARGQTYAVNGIATSMGHANIRPIWRNNEDGPGPKINIGPVLTLGLTLCA